MYGPTGIGILYARSGILEGMPPYQGGGDMIDSVTFEGSTWRGIPHRFEAGTPDIAGAVGLAAAMDYLSDIGMENIRDFESGLLSYTTGRLDALPGVSLVGNAGKRSSVLSFLVEGVHPHDAGTIMDLEGVAVRAGHHCAQPVMDRFGIPATVRASLGIYNSKDDVEALVAGIRKVQEVFG
jgi:cysteine desulfurase/selenocysteine lyase